VATRRIHETPCTVAPAAPAESAVHEDKYKPQDLLGIAVTMAAMMEAPRTSIVNVAIPHMMGKTSARSLDEISWVSTGYNHRNVIVIPMSGWLSATSGAAGI